MHKLSDVVGLAAGKQVVSARPIVDRVNPFEWKGARHETVEFGKDQSARVNEAE